MLKTLFGAEDKTCSPDRFQCADKHDCLPVSWYCDEHADCDDGSDEPDSCGTPVHTCPDFSFKCDNGRCIDVDWVSEVIELKLATEGKVVAFKYGKKACVCIDDMR